MTPGALHQTITTPGFVINGTYTVMGYNKDISMIQKLKNIFHFFNALAAVAYYRYPARNLTVIGVTGTDGKTTTSTLIYHLLKNSGIETALISTVAAYIGDESIDTGFHTTTPSPWAVQKLIHKIVQNNCTHLVLETTSHGLDQHRVLGCNIKIGVVTNITREHLDYHGTYEKYLKAKSKLFSGANHGIINKDDISYKPLTKMIKTNYPSVAVHEYNHHMLAQPNKISNPISRSINSKFPEKYNQLNTIAAVQTIKIVNQLIPSKSLNISDQNISKSISSFPGILGRMQEIPNSRGYRIIVDFAHTPNALEQALSSVRSSTKSRLIAIYGKAGRRDPYNRPVMGEIGARLANLVIFTAEDPRDENVNSIIYQMKQGVKTGHDKIISIADRAKAIDFAINSLAQKGDTIIILGKGHEQSMNLDGITEIPWSDQKAVETALTLKL